MSLLKPLSKLPELNAANILVSVSSGIYVDYDFERKLYGNTREFALKINVRSKQLGKTGTHHFIVKCGGAILCFKGRLATLF